MVTCPAGEFVQTALLLADSFLGMKENCREEVKLKYCPVQKELWWYITYIHIRCVSSCPLDSI